MEVTHKKVYKKILPKYFAEVLAGNKTFELRIDEDNIQVGDTLVLKEWNQKYTGRFIEVEVTYVLRDVPEYGLQEGYCIIGWSHIRVI